MERKLVGYGLRVLLWIVFVVSLYGVEYQRVEDENFQFDDVSGARLLATIQAANVGEPFHFYFADEIAPTSYDREFLYTWEAVSDDFGVMFLTSAYSAVGRAIEGDDFLIDVDTPFLVIFLLYAVTALVFLFSDVPLPLAGAVTAGLAFAIYFGPLALSTNVRTWGTGYAVLLMSMLIVLAAIPPSRWWLRIINVMLLAVLLGMATVIRQEASGGLYIVAVGLVASVVCIGLAIASVRRHQPQIRQLSTPLVSRVGLSAVAILLAVLLTPYITRYIYAQAWDQPFSDTYSAQHGIGMPLYLGMGYVGNPYNLQWLDLTTLTHAYLYEPETNFRMGDEHHQAIMSRAAMDVVTESPWLFFENVLSKSHFVHHFLFFGETPFPSAFNYSEQPWPMQAMYVYSLVLLVAGAWATWRTTDVRLFLAYIAGLSLILGSLVGPLTGFPSYISGIQGATIAVVFALAPLMIYLRRNRESTWSHLSHADKKQITRRSMVIAGGGVGLLVAGAVIVMGGFWFRHQQNLESIRDADPIAEIAEQEFQYGHLFNDLSMEDQRDIVDKLLQTDDPRLFLPQIDTTPEANFIPEVGILTDTQFHLIGWMGDTFEDPAQYFQQGLIYSILQVCQNCTGLQSQYGYDPQAVVYSFINDHHWDGKYRMVSFAISDASAWQNADLTVGLQRLTDWGGGATNFGYQVEDAYTYTMRATTP